MKQQKVIQITENAVKRAKRYKILDTDFSFHGFEFAYPLCCIMWFCFEDCSIRVKVPEYNAMMHKLGNRILCPKCLISKLGGSHFHIKVKQI